MLLRREDFLERLLELRAADEGNPSTDSLLLSARQAERQVRKTPGLSLPYYLSGHALSRLGRLKLAETRLRRAIRLAPHYWDAYRELGAVLLPLHGARPCERTIRRLQRLPRAFPNWGVAFYLQAMMLGWQENSNAAAKWLQENRAYWWGERNALRILRLQNARAASATKLWKVTLAGPRLGSLYSLNSTHTCELHVLANSEQEALAHSAKLCPSENAMPTSVASVAEISPLQRRGVVEAAPFSRDCKSSTKPG